MRKVSIVGMIADDKKVTLYQKSGPPIIIANDGFRIKEIIAAIMPLIAQKKIAVIDLDSYTVEGEIEKKTNGLMRFVKIAGNAVKTLFQKQNVNLGTKDTSYQVAVPDETTVVIVYGKEIPGVEFLTKHMEHAVATNNVIGLQNFMKRIASVIDTRGHTVQELMRFMERGDLPIADDGSIIAYKILQSDEKNPGRYVDLHSRNVSQTVGSRVMMSPDLVDPSKRSECSQGLHIARRGYIGSFSGNIIVLVKVAPEDVIAVPSNEPNKMRTCAYNIVALLSKEAHYLLCGNQPMTSDPASANILANVIKGNHIEVTEHVVIGGAKGSNLTITKIGEEHTPVLMLTEDTATTVDTVAVYAAVKPRDIQKSADSIRAAAAAGDMSAALITARSTRKVEKPSFAQQPTVDPTPITMQATDNEKRDAGVLKLISEGKTQQQTADISGVNHRTVRRIVARNKA